MEDFSFDLSGLLTEEEATRLFEEQTPQEEQEKPAKEKEVETPSEEQDAPEKVGTEENNETEDTGTPDGDGSSPTKFYSSIASALKDDGIFPNLDDEEINSIDSPEKFAELFEKAVEARLDDRMKRIDSVLTNGASPDDVRMYEQTINYLSSITEEAITAEGDEGENLRKQLIYNDLINRGYSQEKAVKEIEKSFKSGSDIDDAKDALAALSTFYQNGYKQLQEDSKKQAEAAKKAQQESADKFKKMVIDDEVKLGDVVLDKRTKQKVFDAVSKPVYKDPETGQLLTQVQKFQKENPLEFLKQLGMWFVLTDGGKSADSFVKQQVRTEKNKGIRELERKINTSELNSDGSLKYLSGNQISNESLLSDGWQIDMGK